MGKIKQKLAQKISELLGSGWIVDPYSLQRNYGANQYNDQVCWDGTAISPSGVKHMISSWDTMLDLVRAERLCIIGNIEPHNTQISIGE